MKTQDQVIKAQLTYGGRVTETIYMTKEAYNEWVLTLSTGDHATHKKTVLKRKPANKHVNDLYDLFPEMRYNTLEKIIDAYNDEGRFANDYMEDESSPLAEFTESFNYGEAYIPDIIKHTDWDNEDTSKLLTDYHQRFGNKKTFDLLASVCKLTYATIYIKSGELYGIGGTIGETEHQPDDALIDAFKSLSKEDQERVRRGVSECYVSDSGWIYVSDDYHRWVMVCNEDQLIKKIKRALKTKRS